MNRRAESTGDPLPLSRARRHNWLKSWQKSIGHADFGWLPGHVGSPQSWSARLRPHSQLQQHEPFPVVERAPLGADCQSHDRGLCGDGRVISGVINMLRCAPADAEELVQRRYCSSLTFSS
jgi:hypothetical protein